MIFGPLGADHSSRIGSNHQFRKEVSHSLLIGGRKLAPAGAHGLTGDQIKREDFVKERPHARWQVLVAAAGVGDRKNLFDRTAQRRCRVLPGGGARRVARFPGRTAPRPISGWMGTDRYA